MEDIRWLKLMLQQELDLRPPTLAKIDKNTILIRDKKGLPIAHAALSNRWRGYEINSVVVDPKERGKGLTHELLEHCDRAPLFAYTRSAHLQNSLIKAGFMPKRSPGLIALLNLAITRAGVFLWMLINLEFRRLFHTTRHLLDYKLFVRS